jgi:transposase
MERAKISTYSKRGGIMQSPEVVEKILYLASAGWGKKRIAKELGTTPKTVRKYLRLQGWQPYQRKESNKKLKVLDGWLENELKTHKGNAAVVHQELARQHNIAVHPRTVQRAVKSFRQKLEIEALATVRFETPPGQQMQIDFGSMKVNIGGSAIRIYLFAATLGHSRKQYVRAFTHERQSAWFEGIEGAFQHFGGVSEHILIDNASALVTKHNPQTREVVFNIRFHAFAKYWGFTPRACAPCRARTKGKDESTVKYIKRNAIAGRDFISWQALEEHLCWWMREIADERIHGTTGEKPRIRFERDEAHILQQLNGKPPFNLTREFQRVVHSDACIEVDANFYSVPWQLIKEQVTVQVTNSEVIIFYGSDEVARHSIAKGKRVRCCTQEHLQGIMRRVSFEEKPTSFLRPLSEYEAVVGGGWV